MEKIAGAYPAKRSIRLPGVQTVRKTKRSGDGTPLHPAQRFPGNTILRVESDRSVPAMSRKNARANLGRLVADRDCAGTEDDEKGRER